MRQKSDVYRARVSFSPDGRRVIRRGTFVLRSDKLYKDNKDNFVLVDVALSEDDDVEQATAAPSEKRNVTLGNDAKK